MDMGVSPARATVSPLVRATANRAMEAITKTRRAALHHMAREAMDPPMGNPSQVDMDHSPRLRAMDSRVSPTVRVAIAAVSPRRVEATASRPPIQATASNNPLHLLLPAMAAAVSHQVMGRSRVEVVVEEEEAMQDKAVVIVAVEGREEDMEAVEHQVGDMEEVEGNSILPSMEGGLTVSPPATVHLHLKAMDKEEGTIRIPHP